MGLVSCYHVVFKNDKFFLDTNVRRESVFFGAKIARARLAWLPGILHQENKKQSDPASGWIAMLVDKPVVWAVAIAILVAWPIARSIGLSLPPKLAVLGALDDFSLVDQTGRAYGSAQLRGKVWVANFIDTRCPTICPVVTNKMTQIRHRTRNLGIAFHLVSFTVDPEHDTPDVLAAYAKNYRASPHLWSFLTGSLPPIENAHHMHFVLVDQRMQIRAFYATEDPGAIDRLLRDAGLLIARGD